MKPTLFLLLNLALLTLNGCVPVAVGTGTKVASVFREERSFSSFVDDSTILAKIKSEMLRADSNSFLSIDVKVTEGRVLLIGKVDSLDKRIEAVKLAWGQKGVKEVINEIKLSEKGKYNLKNYSKDVWITTQVKSKLLIDREIRSVNYNIETEDGIVYIIGIARSAEELDRVLNIASTVSGVKKVINYVRLTNDNLRA